jgi:hypothetical protein
MRLRLVLIAAGLACAFAGAAGAAGSGDRRAAYEAIMRLPDLDQGVWNIDWQARSRPVQPPPQPPPQLTAEYQARLDARRKAGLQNESANCIPPGMPGIMTWPYPFEFLYSPGRVTIAIESDSQVRRIYTDGRGHPADPDPAYNGDSVGHWEGDTLVVDTVALNPASEIAPGVGHSDQARITERIRKTGPDQLEIATTITDPKVLARPWTKTTTYLRHRDWTIKEYVCEQNNHDSVDDVGHPGFKLESQAGGAEPAG